MKQLSLGCNVTSANLIRCSMGATNGNSYISQLVESSTASSRRGGGSSSKFWILHIPILPIFQGRGRESWIIWISHAQSIKANSLSWMYKISVVRLIHRLKYVSNLQLPSFFMGIFFILRWCYWSFQRTLFHSLHLTDTSLLSYFLIHCKDLTIRKRWRRRRNTKPI